MKFVKFIDRGAFYLTVAAGTAGAIAGAYGRTDIAVAGCCVAAIAPIFNRVVAVREQRARGPRALSGKQRISLQKALQGASFKVWVCHNRDEAEPAKFHSEMVDALKASGLDPQWFGGMTNRTIGLEIAGNPSPEKSILMKAFRAAGIPFQDVHFTDDSGGHWGLSIWIGSNPR